MLIPLLATALLFATDPLRAQTDAAGAYERWKKSIEAEDLGRGIGGAFFSSKRNPLEIPLFGSRDDPGGRYLIQGPANRRYGVDVYVNRKCSYPEWGDARVTMSDRLRFGKETRENPINIETDRNSGRAMKFCRAVEEGAVIEVSVLHGAVDNIPVIDKEIREIAEYFNSRIQAMVGGRNINLFFEQLVVPFIAGLLSFFGLNGLLDWTGSPSPVESEAGKPARDAPSKASQLKAAEQEAARMDEKAEKCYSAALGASKGLKAGAAALRAQADQRDAVLKDRWTTIRDLEKRVNDRSSSDVMRSRAAAELEMWRATIPECTQALEEARSKWNQAQVTADDTAKWLTKAQADYRKARTEFLDFTRTHDPSEVAYEHTLQGFARDMQDEVERLCKLSGVMRSQSAPAASQAGPYPGYEQDVADLKFARTDLHKKQNDLDSYRAHYRPGVPGHDPKLEKQMEDDVRIAAGSVRSQENNIRAQGGPVPPDEGPGPMADPYAGDAGRDAAAELKADKDQKAYQQQQVHKAEKFLQNHPEYSRFRNRLFRSDGTVDQRALDQVTAHFNTHGQNPSEVELDNLNSSVNWWKEGLDNTCREVFTGTTTEGKTGWLSMGLRTGLDIATGGLSDFVFTAGDAYYNFRDGVDRGSSGWKLFLSSAGSTLWDAGLNKALGWGAVKGADKFAREFPELTGQLTSSLKKAEQAFAEYKENLFRKQKPFSELSPGLQNKCTSMQRALASGDESRILDLYKDSGMKDLRDLEINGHITSAQAKQLNEVLDKYSNQMVRQSIPGSVRSFHSRTGVKVKELLVGDSGSSGRGGGKRSVFTDADRTTVPVFDKGDLEDYAKGENLTPAQAYEKLARELVDEQNANMERLLNTQGMKPGDIQYGTYDRVFRYSDAGMQADTYPASITANRQNTQGTTTVFQFDADGDLRTLPYTSSGDALLDTNLNLEIDAGRGVDNPFQISTDDLHKVLQQQKYSLTWHDDVKSAAKALSRARDALNKLDKMTAMKIPGKPSGAGGLLELADQIRKNPQDTYGILQNAGMDAGSFVAAAQKFAGLL